MIVWIVRAWSPRDGGWVRTLVGFTFRSEEQAFDGVALFMPLIDLAGDYTDIEVVRTIRFR
mgnify:CR=1 FL=1